MAARATVNSDKRKKSEKEEVIATPYLLDGEIILAKAQKILKFNSMSKRGSGVMGRLFITNFKLAFMTAKVENSPGTSTRSMRTSCRSLDDLLAADDTGNVSDYIPLTCINCLTGISTEKQKSKIIKNGKVPSKKYDIVEITCRDLRIIQFDFSLCGDPERKSVISTILHYAFPTNLQRLFAFDYAASRKNRSPSTSSGRAFYTFRHEKDLELELARLKGQQQWRVSRANKEFILCKGLPEFNIFPAELSDEDLKKISESYTDGRLPVWVWNADDTGAALLISGSPVSKVIEKLGGNVLMIFAIPYLRNQETEFSGHSHLLINAIRHNSNVPQSFDAVSYFPLLRDLQSSYSQICEACLYKSDKEFWSGESNWLSKLDGSRWLEHSRTALKTATKIAKLLTVQNTSVIVHEPSGRDYSSLLVSLVQIIVDPHYRTLIGLQSLIQKEWAIKGHCFLRRLGLISVSEKRGKNKATNYDSNGDVEESPVFLLFLDCVYQLLRQFPTRFEYTDIFLVMLIDSIYTCLFETFLFETELQRKHFDSAGNLETVWDLLATVPSSKYRTLFVNPLYSLDGMVETRAPSWHSTLPPSTPLPSSSSTFYLPDIADDMENGNICDNKNVIFPNTSSIHSQLWTSCFLRWQPAVDLYKGSSSEVSRHLQQVELLEEAKYLEQRLAQLQNTKEDITSRTQDDSSSLSSQDTSSINRRKTQSKKYRSQIECESYTELISNFTFCSLFHPC